MNLYSETFDSKYKKIIFWECVSEKISTKIKCYKNWMVKFEIEKLIFWN